MSRSFGELASNASRVHGAVTGEPDLRRTALHRNSYLNGSQLRRIDL